MRRTIPFVAPVAYALGTVVSLAQTGALCATAQLRRLLGRRSCCGDCLDEAAAKPAGRVPPAFALPLI